MNFSSLAQMDVRKRGENPPLPRSREGNENPYRRQVTMPLVKTTGITS
jgi:hypothetical protein